MGTSRNRLRSLEEENAVQRVPKWRLFCHLMHQAGKTVRGSPYDLHAAVPPKRAISSRAALLANSTNLSQRSEAAQISYLALAEHIPGKHLGSLHMATATLTVHVLSLLAALTFVSAILIGMF